MPSGVDVNKYVDIIFHSDLSKGKFASDLTANTVTYKVLKDVATYKDLVDASLPTMDVNSAYTFDNWYTDVETTVVCKDGDVYNVDTNLYAKYTNKDFNIAEVVDMTIINQPKLKYIDGDKIDYSSLTVKLKDSNGVEKTVNYSDFVDNNLSIGAIDFDGNSLNQIDTGKTIPVVFNNSVTTITKNTDSITVSSKIIPGTTKPTGQADDYVVVTLTASNGTIDNSNKSFVVAKGVSFSELKSYNENGIKFPSYDQLLPNSGYRFERWEESSLDILDSKKFETNTTLNAEFVKDEVQSFVIKNQPKLDYNEGDSVNLTDLIVTLTYQSGRSEDVKYSDFGTNGLSIVVDSAVKDGDVLSVSDAGKVATIKHQDIADTKNTDSITVLAKVTEVKPNEADLDKYHTVNFTVESSKGTFAATDKTTYYILKSANITWGQAKNDFEKKIVVPTVTNVDPSNFIHNGWTPSFPSDETIISENLTYDANFNIIEFNENDVRSFVIKNQPKLSYTDGDTIDLTSLVITLSDGNGKTKEVNYIDFTDNGLTITTDSALKAGDVLGVIDTGKVVTIKHNNVADAKDTDSITVSPEAVNVADIIVDPTAEEKNLDTHVLVTFYSGANGVLVPQQGVGIKTGSLVTSQEFMVKKGMTASDFAAFVPSLVANEHYEIADPKWSQAIPDVFELPSDHTGQYNKLPFDKTQISSLSYVPPKRSYYVGDSMDLSSMRITLIDIHNNEVTLTPDQFASYDIAVNYPSETVLVANDNDKAFTFTVKGYNGNNPNDCTTLEVKEKPISNPDTIDITMNIPTGKGFIKGTSDTTKTITETVGDKYSNIFTIEVTPSKGYVFDTWTPSLPDANQLVDSGDNKSYTAVFKMVDIFTTPKYFNKGDACSLTTSEVKDIKDLPDGVTIEDVTETNTINTNEIGKYQGKIKVTYPNGDSQVVTVDVYVTPLAPVIDKITEGAKTITGISEPDIDVSVKLPGVKLPIVVRTDSRGRFIVPVLNPSLIKADTIVEAIAVDNFGNVSPNGERKVDTNNTPAVPPYKPDSNQTNNEYPPYVQPEVIQEEVNVPESEQIVEPISPNPSTQDIMNKNDNDGGSSWALFNLLFALSNVALAVISLFFRRIEEDDEINANLDEDEAIIVRKNITWKLLNVVIAIAAIIIFVLTENMKLSMRFVDKYTLLMLLLAVVGAFFTFKIISKKEVEPEEINDYYRNS